MANFISDIWNSSNHGERCLLAVCGTALGAGAVYAGYRTVNHLIDTHDYYSDSACIVRSRRPDRHNRHRRRENLKLPEQGSSISK